MYEAGMYLLSMYSIQTYTQLKFQYIKNIIADHILKCTKWWADDAVDDAVDENTPGLLFSFQIKAEPGLNFIIS